MKTLSSFWLWTVIAIVGIAVEPLWAQCPCGGSGGSTGATNGTNGNGCGCGSGPRASRVDRPARARGMGGEAVDPARVPAWQRPSAEALESAASEKRPIVVYFADETDDVTAMTGEGMAELSKTSAVFVKVPHTADRAKSPWAAEGVVPVNKLLSDNPARDFGISADKAAVLVLDWFGNEHARLSTGVKAIEVRKHLDKIAKTVEDMNAKLQKQLDRANEAKEKSNRKDALKFIMKNFKEGVVGMPAQEETIRLYHAIMDEARAEISKLADSKDADGLKAMARDLKKTDVEKEISDAISKLS